ncbi:MAG: ABC transporter substrate binding protein [Chloroflexota bacterium]|nr:ABC transporter substrate binding protein [Chloroflexota bacterium]MDE2910503.1 ABC transporter substrate binding protein [Chloroflexota bacterium]
MTKLAVLTLTLVSLLAAQASMAQPDDNPTIAWIKWGDSRNVALAEKAILDMLEVYGFISAEERALLDEEHSIEGERLNIIYGDALYDRIEANAIIDKALDRNADVFITFNTQVTQIVYYAIREFTDPPKLIFTVTSGPYITGVADASCVKPDFVIGTVPVTNYEDIVPLLLMQDPDMKVVGALYSPQQRASEVGVERITAIGESLGLTVVAESIIVTPDLYQAVENLYSRGAEAIIIPIFTFQGFQLLLSLSYDYGLPVVFSAPQNAYRGGTIGGGFYGLYKQGVIAGNMLIGHLNGDMDIASTSIYESDDFAFAVNLDAADLQDVEVSQALLDGAAYIVEDGQSAQGVTLQWPEAEITLPDMSLEERRAADLELLAALECTPELIAEQQAALDAAAE